MQAPLATVCNLDAPRSTFTAIRASGGLDAAIAAAANHPRQKGLDDLVRLRSALEDRDDPGRRAAGLRAASDRLRRRIERLTAEAADFHGRAVYRRAQGEYELADALTRQGAAADGLAHELSEEALSLSLDAAEIERRLEDAKTIAGIACG